MHRRDADVERVVADDVGALVVDEAEAAQVGDVADVGGAVAQDVEDVTNGVARGQRQADPDFVAGRFAVARRVVAAHVFDVVKQRFVGIEQADLPHDEARQRVAADGAEDFAAGGVVADEGEAARVVPGSAQAAQQPVGDEAAHDAQGKGGAKPDAEPEAGEVVSCFGEVEVARYHSGEVEESLGEAQQERRAQGSAPGAVNAAGAQHEDGGERGEGGHPLVAFPLPDGVAEVRPEGDDACKVDADTVGAFCQPVHVGHDAVARGFRVQVHRLGIVG